MISVGFMYSFGQLPGFFLWSSQLRNNLLLTGHVAETHSEGVTNLPVFLTNFLLELRGDFQFSILDFWVIKMRVRKCSSKLSRKYNQTTEEFQSEHPGSVLILTHVFFPPTYWRKGIPQLFTMLFDSCHHEKSTCSPETNSGTAASPFTGDVTRVTWEREESTEFPRAVSIQLDVKSQNGKCTVHVRHVLSKRMPSRFRSLLAKEMRLKLKAKKGSNADGMRSFISQFSYLVATH